MRLHAPTHRQILGQSRSGTYHQRTYLLASSSFLKKKKKKKKKTGRTEILSIQGYSTYCASLIRERSDQGRRGQTGKTVANLSTPRPRGRDVHVGRNFLDSKAPDSTASPGPFSWEPETDASRVRISGRCGLTHLLSQVRHALSRIYKKVV